MHPAPGLHDPEFYVSDPFPTYRRMRREAPVYWYRERGFWALSRYEDVRRVSIDPELFTSTRGIMIPDTGEVTPEMMDLLIFNDPPRHRDLRALIKGGFTPQRVAALEPRLRELASEVTSAIRPGDEIDLAQRIAAPFPTVVIAELIGAPSEDWETFRAWSDAIIGSLDPAEEMSPGEAHAALHAYFLDLIAKRRAQPRDDLLSQLLQAQRDGAPVSDDDVYYFCWLLLIAGNETTRNLISLGTQALIEHPDQLRLVLRDPAVLPLAIEEMLRWCNPVTHMARTALRDTEIRGQKIRAGERVVLLYGAANRDEEVFGPDAEEFRVTRHPNRHIQFGFGEHICIGAHLARLEARIIFEQLLPHLETATVSGEVRRTRATMVPGVKSLPIRFAA